MAKISIPTNEKAFRQPNTGDGTGNIFHTFGVDFDFNRGVISSSPNPLSAYNTGDDASFTGYVAQFVEYNNKIWAIGDEVFRTNTTAPISGWAVDSDTDTLSPGNTVTDAVAFDGMLLAIDGDDIWRNPGDGDWDSWWKTLRSQSALTTGSKKLLKVGFDNNLYILDNQAKLYRVAPDGSGTGTITTSGQGTIDFTNTDHTFNCMETTSTRMFIGTSHPREGAIIEWDLGPQSISPNKVHPIGAKSVLCIAVWNDTPIAVLSDGSVMIYNGTSFQEYTGFRFPSKNIELEAEFIHNNGWAIIDKMPHFLVSPKVSTGGTDPVEDTTAPFNFPAGVWCLDPDVGLYCRFPMGVGESTQEDYGQYYLDEPGALFAFKSKDSKFLCSYDYYDGSGSAKATISYADLDYTKSTHTHFTTPFLTGKDVWTKVSGLHKHLESGEEIRVYYRNKPDDEIRADGYWLDTSTFNTTDSVTGVEVGDMAIVATGAGAPTILIVDSITDSGTVNSIAFTEANSLAAVNDEVTIKFLNFKKMATLTNTGIDWFEKQIPSHHIKRKIQVFIEMRSVANNRMELDNVIIES